MKNKLKVMREKDQSLTVKKTSQPTLPTEQIPKRKMMRIKLISDYGMESYKSVLDKNPKSTALID
jgi:hypothetical protein